MTLTLNKSDWIIFGLFPLFKVNENIEKTHVFVKKFEFQWI